MYHYTTCTCMGSSLSDDVAPIPDMFNIVRTIKTKNLDDNIGLLKVKLNNKDLKEIYDLVPINEVAGDRIHCLLIHFTCKFANTLPKIGD
ncbi:Aldo/keto reductase/potassium channel subunit beta [Parasponia andersonii]|uniref:Aldo/keto reductase/potassium channel subunit beta n=1 Tax=Parasponia andersonii TaxID=3476 RepID=A0A2P5DKM3_PARAD|nr:Aldo/keto reductase/potassium channel subunit beta [Parasponia andersonii]